MTGEIEEPNLNPNLSGANCVLDACIPDFIVNHSKGKKGAVTGVEAFFQEHPNEKPSIFFTSTWDTLNIAVENVPDVLSDFLLHKFNHVILPMSMASSLGANNTKRFLN